MRQLSAFDTLIRKVLFPFFFLVFFGLGVALMWIQAARQGQFGSTTAAQIKWLFLGTWIIGTIQALRFMRIKRVRIDATHLYVSNFRREIVIPVSAIAEVTARRSFDTYLVTIRLHSTTEFGQEIVFAPHKRWFEGWRGPHPVIEELRQLARGMPV